MHGPTSNIFVMKIKLLLINSVIIISYINILLQSCSSLGQNLETSDHMWDNFFSIFISIFGLLLVLYFIGSVQVGALLQFDTSFFHSSSTFFISSFSFN
jgi:hypothetical protein